MFPAIGTAQVRSSDSRTNAQLWNGNTVTTTVESERDNSINDPLPIKSPRVTISIDKVHRVIYDATRQLYNQTFISVE